jgi:hypothetical protein
MCIFLQSACTLASSPDHHLSGDQTNARKRGHHQQTQPNDDVIANRDETTSMTRPTDPSPR